MAILFANNAVSTLAGSISDVATTATLAAGTGALFPAPTGGDYFIMTFVNASTGLLREIIHVTARTADVLTIVRAQEGTTALAWTAGDLASNFHTAGAMNALAQTGDIPGLLIERRVLTSSGAVSAPAGASYAFVSGIGGGGGGGSADVTSAGEFTGGSGGGAGGFGEVRISDLTSLVATIGTPGAGGIVGVISGFGGPGGNTTLVGTFGTITFPGGGGGAGGVAFTPPSAIGGGASGALASQTGGVAFLLAGGDAGGICQGFTPQNGFSGSGANSNWGTGGGETGSSTNGATGTGYGVGGSGGLNFESQVTTRTGGAGRQGVLYIDFYS